MADLALRADPVPSEPAIFDGVSIRLAEPKVRKSLRARSAEVLAAALACPVPRQIGKSEGDIVCLGPDEWLLRAGSSSTLPDTSGQPLSIVDVSERSITLSLEGPRAVDVLAAGCPRNLAALPVGEGRRTVFEGVEIVVIRCSDCAFEVDVWRSFAPWLHLALVTAASHLR